MDTYRKLEDLIVYQKLCQLHIEVSELTHRWPAEERYELGSQARRSSNSSPAQLAEKYDDRHVRNKIEGINRSRGEAAETVHHLFMAHLKGYDPLISYEKFRDRYRECIRMLNGMERTLEAQLPENDRRWPITSVREDSENTDAIPQGYPEPSASEPHPQNPITYT
jgi:four helix bundle protein